MRWLFVLLMLFLVACSSSNEIIAQKITKDITTTDNVKEPFIEEEKTCDKVICANGFVCEDGECVCKGKACGDKCILNGCCEDDDCSSEQHCVNFKCMENAVCEYHQVFDQEQDKCVCEEDYFFCEEQNKCLIGGSCCHQGDCDRFSTCVETTWAVSVCFQYPEKKLCRMLRNLRVNENIITPEGDFFVMLENVLSGGIVKIKINTDFYEMKPEEKIDAAQGTVWVEEIKIFGGTCKVED